MRKMNGFVPMNQQGSYLGLATLRSSASFGSSNGGWAYDAYPELETLDAGRSITVAEIEGPAVITRFHSTCHFVKPPAAEEQQSPELNALCARGIVLEVYYNEVETPAVRVPLGDFFADGCGGRAAYFSTPFIEKSRDAYNCFIPMPFKGHARVVLRNDTAFGFMNYSFVEFERLPAWNDSLGYFHATWRRWALPVCFETDERFLKIEGRGHLIGRAWSVATDEPQFPEFGFVMEGNNGVFVDGETKPRADYLGSEDSFGYSWGFRGLSAGHRSGINVIQQKNPSLLSIYEFRDVNAIPFMKSLEWRVNWRHEFRGNQEIRDRIAARRRADGCWVDYATTHYWYQDHVGYAHEPMAPLEDRVKCVLRSNPLES